jgi:hypothetical protein
MKTAEGWRKLELWGAGGTNGTCTGRQERPAAQSLVGRKAGFWAAAALGVFVLLVFAADSGVTVWLAADAILWGGFIAALRQFAFEGRYSNAMMVLALVLLVFGSLILLGAAAAK